MRWPYPATSIWNRPIGDGAVLKHARIGHTATGSLPDGPPLPTRTIRVEEDIIVASPGAVPVPIQHSSAGWAPDPADRCEVSGAPSPISVEPIPQGWNTDDVRKKQNRSTAIVREDLTLFETQPMEVCDDAAGWRVTSMTAKPAWDGDSIVDGGAGPTPIESPPWASEGGGAHGGSYLSAFGGTIRGGEWVAGGVIPHATKIVVPPRLLSACDPSAACDGFRWPAMTADSAFATPGANNQYTGSNPFLQMGSLLSVDAAFDPETELTTEAARIIARSIQRYGSYVSDVTGTADYIAFSIEEGPDGDVESEFLNSFGFALDAPQPGDPIPSTQLPFLQDMKKIYRKLQVVDNNVAGGITSGGGTPRWVAAPDFTDRPLGTIATPYENEVFQTTSPTFRGHAYDVGQSPDKIRFVSIGIKNSSGLWWNHVTSSWVSSATYKSTPGNASPGAPTDAWSYTPTAVLADGSYELVVRNRDWAGIVTQYVIGFSVDAVP